MILTTSSGGSSRLLGKVNPATGVVTSIGPTSQQFAGIAWDITGTTLYGVTGDGATTPETLYTLNPSTGAATFFLALGNGNDGETICIDALTNDILHLSGLGSQVFESINTTTRTVSNITMTGAAISEALSITHLAGRNFLMADLNDDLFVVTSGGLFNQVGTLDHSYVKGMAIVPTVNASYFRLYGGGCAATTGGQIPALVGVGTPAAGNAVTVGIFNGPAAVPAILTIGTGTAVAPISPNCSLQNLQLLTFAFIPLTLGGANPGEGTVNLPLQLPAGFGPVNLFLQAVVIEIPQLTLVVTNPLQMHVQ
jgi:hypothetical protein